MVWTRTFRPKRIPTYAGGPVVLGNSEKRVVLQLKEAGVPFTYETSKLRYHVSKDCIYTPDIVLNDGTCLEVKGLFEAKDRVKHLLIKEQHPDVTVKFIFDNSTKKLSKTSKTTYKDWCQKHGFECADKLIPKDWL